METGGMLLKDFNVNSSANQTKDEELTNLDSADVFQAVLLSLMILAGVVGNSLVVAVVALKSEMRTRTNFFFTNLAMAEIMMCVVCVPFMVTGLVTKHRSTWSDDFICKTNYFMLQFCFIECVLTLIALSLHKYVSVLKPLKRIITRKRAILIIILTWILAFLYAVGTVLGSNRISYNPDASICYSETLSIIHVIFLSCISYVMPVVSLAIIYSKVMHVVHKHLRRIRNTCIIDDRGVKAKRRIVITICIVLALFFSCWTPFVIQGIISTVSVPPPRHLLRAALYCGFSFNVLSPIVLVARNPRFKRGFYEILTWWKKRQETQVNLGTSFSSTFSNMNPSFEYLEEKRCSVWYMSTQKNLLSLETVPPERRLKLRWIETNL